MSRCSSRSRTTWIGEIGPVMDQRGNDLSRIGQEAQDVADRPEDLRIMIIIEYPAMPSIGIGKCVSAVKVVQHGEVRSGVHDVQVRGPQEVSAQSITPVIRSPSHMMFPG